MARILAASNGTPVRNPEGRSGTQNVHGFIRTDEMVPEFKGKALFRTVDRMVRSDPVVRAALLMVALPLREAEWTVSPAGPSDLDREAAELVRRALLEHVDWPQVVWDLVYSALRYGRGLVEETYEAVEWNLTYDDEHQSVEVPARTYWVPRRYGPRLARTIDRWHVDEEGDLEAVTQVLPQATSRGVATVQIPASQLVVFVNERDGDNYEGTSLLRPMYRSWYAKEKLEIIDAIRAERAGVGVPVGWSGDGDPSDMEDHLANLRVNEEGYIVLAGGPPGTDQHHQHVEMLDMRAASTADIGASLHYHTTQILWGVLGAWQQLGQGNVGARATSETQDDPFYLLVSSVARSFASAVNRQAIPRLCRYNYANLDRFPRLTVGSLPGADFASIVDGVAKLLTAGGVESDLELENWLRRKMGVPERRPDEEEDAPVLVDSTVDDSDEGGEEAAPPAAISATVPFQEAMNAGLALQRFGLAAQNGVLTFDEARSFVGLDPIGEYDGEVETPRDAVKDPDAAPDEEPTDAPPGDDVEEPDPFVEDEEPRSLSRRVWDAIRGAVTGTPVALAAEQHETRMADGTTFAAWRPLTALETHVLFQATDTTIREMREEYQRETRAEVQRLAAFAAGAAAGDRQIEADMLERAEAALAERIAEVLTRVAGFGRVAVRSEIQSQRGRPPAPSLSVSDAVTALAQKPPKDPERLDAWITRISKGSARAVTTRITMAAERGGSRLAGLPHENLLERVTKSGESAVRAEATGTVAHALSAGRRAEAEEARDRGESSGFATYSAVLDSNTCGPCMALDGSVYEVGTPEYERDYPPLYACDGGDACRCVMIVEALQSEVLDEEEVDPTAG